MAELSGRQKQNQAFLQELEKQRLNKPCLRIIDLRGKVAGECQAYEFGERVHYLDDRAFLLVKQLMARFDGRYTIGVYETLFKALKQLNTPSVPADKIAEPTPTIMQLDKAFRRSEARSVITTPVKLRLNDVLYHGHTIDLSTQAIRVSCKRTFSLELGDKVGVEFTDLAEQSGLDTLRHVSYHVIKIEHDEAHTSLVLRLEPGQHGDVALWLNQWLEQQSSPRQHDVDNELLNIQAELYQRLWLSRLTSPLLWLGKSTDSADILKLHLTASAHQLIAQCELSESEWLAKLPLDTLFEQQESMLCSLDQHTCFSAKLSQTDAVQSVINWHLATAKSQLLLVHPTMVNVEPASLNHCLNHIEAETGLAEASCELDRVSVLLTFCDLTQAFTHTLPTATVAAAELSTFSLPQMALPQMPEPTALRPCIRRDKARFYIRTPVTVHAGDSQWQLETLDVSADGLAIQLPAEAKVSLNQRLHIDFSRWQSLTSKVKLEAVPYLIKNIRDWQGQKHIGLGRIKNNCAESLNNFFDWVIAQNQQSLRLNHQDVITAAEGQLFSQLLLPNLSSVPIFIGLDNTGQRRFQLIGKTAANGSDQRHDLWLALEHESLRWTELLKQAERLDHGSLLTTLYAYKNGHIWTLAIEQDFNQARDKALFIRRGLDATDFMVLQVTATILKGLEADQEYDLQTRLQQLRPKRAHRVRALRQQLSQLVGMLELTDISDSIRLFFSR